MTFEDGATVEMRQPHYDRAGRLWADIVAKLDGLEVNHAQINLRAQRQRVDFHQVAMGRDGRVDWQDYLFSVIKPLREAIEARQTATEGGGDTSGPRRTPTLVTLSDVPPEPVTWLGETYIPRRKLTLLEGDPGVGKTWLPLAIAATVMHGRVLGRGRRASPLTSSSSLPRMG